MILIPSMNPRFQPTLINPMRLLILPFLFSSAMAAGPLKVFILAGQSNMQGHAKIETFDYIGDDPATAPLLKEMRAANGKPRVCDGAWISYLSDTESSGELTAGFGATKEKIGPEFTFGLAMDAAFEEPVLLIKTAWGGKSLYEDFRPPSAGPYPGGKKVEASGEYYRMMISHVKKVLGDVKKVCPAYDEKQGYEIAGFVWFQGFNDMVNREAYPIVPKGVAANRFANYSVWMADLIRDTRKDLGVPKMPFVIGVLGVDGADANPDNLAFREAMAAPAALPEFKGNVVAVRTSPFWDEPLAAVQKKREQVNQMAHLLKTKNKNHPNKDGTMSDADQKAYLAKLETELITPKEAAMRERGASNAGYHYLGCAKTFALIGKAFAKALLEMKP